ncbi:MAG: Rieske 2Fe-2S domain-containing protein [Pseudomonadales bacterium]|jgi:3-phenylpropionate/trans-cinnamate dioxygenase ferredoxin subunit|nr:Rieske 2Fe-2S domain-containing protein [Pseudomonadales bacterium]
MKGVPVSGAVEGEARVVLGPEGDFPVGTPVAVAARGWKLLVFRHAGGLSVFENRCTHAATRLDTGRLKDCVVACPLHRARFDLRDGAVLSGPATKPLPSFPASIEDGRVLVALPEKPGPSRPPPAGGPPWR